MTFSIGLHLALSFSIKVLNQLCLITKTVFIHVIYLSYSNYERNCLVINQKNIKKTIFSPEKDLWLCTIILNQYWNIPTVIRILHFLIRRPKFFINYRFLAFFSRLMVILSDAYLSSSYCDTSLYKWIWDSDCNKIYSTVLLSNLRTKCTEREENKSRLHWYFPDCHK